MKEAQIRKKFKEAYPKDEIWFAPKVKWKAESDIFGVFDAVMWSTTGIISFWQLTTLSNISARRKKIKARINNKKFGCSVFVAGWNKKKKIFKIIKINAGNYFPA